MNYFSITIDEDEKKLKAMYHFQAKPIGYKEYALSTDLFKNKVDYNKIFLTIHTLCNEIGVHSGSFVYVLPDKYVASDYFEIPTFSKKKLGETLNLQMTTRFPQCDTMHKSFLSMGDYDVNSAYSVYMVNSELVSKISAAAKSCKFPFKNITFASAMKANAFLSLRTQRRRDAILLADIKTTYTSLILIKDCKLVGFGSLPYGANILVGSADLDNPPPILPSDEYYANQCDSTAQLAEFKEGDGKKNAGIFLDTLCMMADTASARYHLEGLQIRYNIDKKLGNVFAGYTSKNYRNFEPINTKNQLITEHLALYGALNPKQYAKGLLF